MSLDSLGDDWAKALNLDGKKFNMFFDKMMDGFAYHKILLDKTGKPVDYVFLEVNKAFEKMTLLKREKIIGKKVTEVIKGIENDPADWIGTYGKVALNCEPLQFENFAKPLGKWYKVSAYCPEKGYFIVLFEDITDRKKAENELINSERRWSTTLSSIGDAVISTDAQGKITFMNPVAQKLTGWTFEQGRNKQISKIFNIVNEKTRQKVESPIIKVLEKGLTVGLANHTVLIRKDGSELPIDDSGAPIKADDGKTTGVVLVFRDISERKKAEEKIVVQALMIANANDAIVGYDLEQKTIFWNKAAEKLYGYTEHEALGKRSVDLLKPIYINHKREDLVRKLAKVGHLETESIRLAKSGEKRIIDAHVILLSNESGKQIGYVSVDRDITERKKSETALKRQAALIDLSPDATIVRSLDGIIGFWSKGAETLYGWTKKEAIGQTTHKLFQTKFPKRIEDILAELKIKERWIGDLVHKTKDGKEITVQSRWLAEKTDRGEIVSILESNVDITERIYAEKEISRLASFPTLNPNSVFEVDFSGKINYANPATKILFPDLEKLGSHHEFLSNWRDVAHVFADETRRSYGREVKVNEHWYHQSIYLVSETNMLRVYVVDIDELKQLEESRAKTQVKLEENTALLEEYASQMEELAEQRAHQLKNSERMAAIGQTAGMVGHDIRNPLQAITSDMYLITEEAKNLPEGESKQSIFESIDSVNENLTYINKIVSDLQDYTRPLKPTMQEINLSELIASTILTINAPKKIEFDVDIRDDCVTISTDIAYLRRIFTNIITNAVQAMPGQGKVTIKATKRKDKIHISVQDTGVGIPKEVKDKMFVPLFTTKSKGQGLGLAVVKRLVESLGGTISFESETLKGTKFTIELPQSLPTK